MTVELPRWLRVVFLAVADAPWTNIKTLNALILTNGTAAFLVFSAFFQVKIDASLFEGWLIFVGSMLGISTLGQLGKRMTYQPSPPAVPDIEDAKAGSTTPP